MAEFPTEDEAAAAIRDMLGGESPIAEPPESEPEAGDEAEAESAFLEAFFGGEEPSTTEPPVDALPPADKPIADYTEAENAAVAASLDHKLRERGERERREREEAEARRQAEADKTDEQLLADSLIASAQPRAKAASNEALIRSIHGIKGDEGL